jgi:transcriptional regulator with XRE-family HTH domain
MGSSRPQPKWLAAKLRQIRISLGLTQQQMVERLKSQKVRLTVYSGNISRFEQGVREPSLPVLLAYARAAGVSIDVLVDDDLELSERLPHGAGQKRRTGRGR